MGNSNGNSHISTIGIISWFGREPIWFIYICFSDGKNTTTNAYRVRKNNLLMDILSGYPWKISRKTHINIYTHLLNRPLISIIGNKYFNGNNEKISQENAERILYDLLTN